MRSGKMHSVLSRRYLVPVFLAVTALLCSTCNGQLKRLKPPYQVKPIRNTPLDPSTLLPPSKEATSSLGIVVLPPYIDEKGNVWSKQFSNKPVAKAHIKHFHNKPEAWWVSDYKDSSGAPQPRRAPRSYDRVETLGNVAKDDKVSPKIETASSRMSIRTRINPKTGQVVREVLRDGSVQRSSVIGKATLETDDSGQQIWVYGDKSIPAAASSVPVKQLSPEQQIAVGILQILDSAARRQQQNEAEQQPDEQ